LWSLGEELMMKARDVMSSLVITVRPDTPVAPAVDKPVPGTVEEVMTGTPLGVPPDADLTDVVSLMLEANVRSMPVVDDGALVGIVSRRDVLRVVARGELTPAERPAHGDQRLCPCGAPTPDAGPKN
jgi:CBS domain-containing protein